MASATDKSLPLMGRKLKIPGLLKRETVLAALILGAALIFYYRDVVLMGHTFLIETGELGTMPPPTRGAYGYDDPPNRIGHAPLYWDPGAIAVQMEPWDRFIAESYQNGQLPVWDPYQGLGYPIYANGQTGMFDPLKVLIYFAPPGWWPVGMDFHLLLCYFLAGLFSYLFVRALGVSFAGGLAAGLSYMLATYLVMFGNISFVRLASLLPMLVFAYHRLATKPGFGSLSFVASAIFLQIVGDFPEILPLHIGLGLAWYAAQGYLTAQKSPKKWSVAVRVFWQGLLATFVGVLLGSFILLPFLQLLGLASHTHSPDQLGQFGSGTWSWYLIGSFLSGWDQFQSRLSIIGAALTVFGLLIGYKHRGLPHVRMLLFPLMTLLVIALIFIFVAFRFVPLGWVASLPVLNMIYLNKYVQPIVVFCVACTAGIGLDYLLTVGLQKRLRYLVLSVIVVTLLFFISILLLQNDYYYIWAQVALVAILQSLLLLLFILAAYLATRSSNGIPIAAIIVCTLLVVESSALNGSVAHPIRYDPYTVPPFVAYLRQTPGTFRIMATDGILYPNIASAYRLDDIRYTEGPDYTKLNVFRKRFLEHITSPNINTETRLDGLYAPPIFGRAMDLLNVEYVLTANPAPPPSDYVDPSRFQQVYQAAGVYIFRNQNAFPRAFVVHQVEVQPDFNLMLDRFAAPDFDPHSSVILDTALPPTFTQSLPQQPLPYQVVDVVSRDNLGLTVHVVLDRPGVLVLSELNYPGWQASADGAPVPIYNAYGFMRAVPLAVGEHTISFTYRPALLMLGLAISGITLFLLLGIGLLTFHRRSARRSTPSIMNIHVQYVRPGIRVAALKWDNRRRSLHKDGSDLVDG